MPTALTYDASDAHLSRWQQTIEKSLKECEICSMLTEKKKKKKTRLYALIYITHQVLR